MRRGGWITGWIVVVLAGWVGGTPGTLEGRRR
jgi:hypothetical protein